MEGTALQAEKRESAAARTAASLVQEYETRKETSFWLEAPGMDAGPVLRDSVTSGSWRHRVLNAVNQTGHVDIDMGSAAHSPPWLLARPPVRDRTGQEWMPPGWSVGYDAEAWARDERIQEWLKQQDFSELQLEADDAGDSCSDASACAASTRRASDWGSSCKEGSKGSSSCMSCSVADWLPRCEGRMYAVVEDSLSDRRFFATASADERGLNIMRGRRAGVHNRKLLRGGGQRSMDPCVNELLPGAAVPSACHSIETSC